MEIEKPSIDRLSPTITNSVLSDPVLDENRHRGGQGLVTTLVTPAKHPLNALNTIFIPSKDADIYFWCLVRLHFYRFGSE